MARPQEATYAVLLSHEQVEQKSRMVAQLLQRLPSIARTCHVDTDRCLARCWRCLGDLLPERTIDR